MEDIKNIKQITINDVDEVGEKAARLGELSKEFNVAPGFVLTYNIFDRFLEALDLKRIIRAKLNYIDDDNVASKAEEVQRLIVEADLPLEIRDQIVERYYSLNINDKAPLQDMVDSVKEPLVIVRSSPYEEVGENVSLLHVQGKEKLVKSIIALYASLYVDEALKKRKDKVGKLAIIVQKMVLPYMSGKIVKDGDRIRVSSCFGLYENDTPMDHYFVNSDMKIESMTVERQDTAYMLDDSTGKLSKVNLPEAKADNQKLNEQQIAVLARLYRKTGVSETIEYLVDKEKYYFTQLGDTIASSEQATESEDVPQPDAEQQSAPEEQAVQEAAQEESASEVVNEPAEQEKPAAEPVLQSAQEEKPAEGQSAGGSAIFSIFNANREGTPDVPLEPKREAPPQPATQEAEKPVEQEPEQEELISQNTETHEDEVDEQVETVEVSSDEPTVVPMDDDIKPEISMKPLSSEEWLEALDVEHTKVLLSYDLIVNRLLAKKYMEIFKQEAPPSFDATLQDLKRRTDIPHEDEIRHLRQLRNRFMSHHRTITIDDLQDGFQIVRSFVRDFQ